MEEINVYKDIVENSEGEILYDIQRVCNLILAKIKYVYDANIYSSQYGDNIIPLHVGEEEEPKYFNFSRVEKSIPYDMKELYEVESSDGVIIKKTDTYLSVEKSKNEEYVWKIILLGETSVFHKVSHNDLASLDYILGSLECMNTEAETAVGIVEELSKKKAKQILANLFKKEQ